jgi:hypothetical protein
MKKSLLILLFALGVTYWGWGQLLNENFSYAVGSALTDNGWSITGTNASPVISVTASSISYPGYLSSGIGEEVTLATSGQDVNHTFTSQTTGSVYASCLVNITSATTTGDYFFHLGASTIGSTYHGRVYVKRDASNNLAFGISRAGAVATAIFTPYNYALNTTYLVVLRYTIVAGITNDIAAIYINPTLNSNEPSTGWTFSTDAPADLANIGTVALRQGGATTAAAIKLDGIRVATTWADIVGTSGGLPTKLAVISINGGSSPISGVPFSIIIQSQDGSNVPQNVTSDVNIALTGTGIGGTTTGTILNGQSSVTITGVTMSEGYGLTITATQTSGTPALISGTSAPFNVTSATPNYRSKTSGNWNVAGTWEIQISGNWYDAPDFPNSPNKVVTILNGHTVEVTDNNGKCGNLTIDAGGKLWKNSTTVASYLYVYGNILNNGTIGSSDAGVTPSALGFDIEGTSCLISGSGTFDAWRMAKFTTTNTTTNLIIEQDVTLRNTVPSTVYNSAASTTLNILINSSKKLDVPGSSINLLNVNLTLASDANLLDNGTILGQTGTNVTVERSIPGGEWHLISAPISDAVSGMFTGEFLQMHTESTNLYTDITLITEPLIPVKGFALYGGTGFTAQYTGTLNTGMKSIALTRATTGINSGWNLVGNPYPSSIDWLAASGWTKTNVNNATYIHVNNATWAEFVGGVGTNGGTQYIAPGQGFFVNVADDGSTDGTLAMVNAVRVHNATTFFKNSLNNLVRIEVSGNGYTDEAVVRFHELSTSGFDGDYDAYKLLGAVDEAAQIYSIGSNMLSINALPEAETVNLGMNVNVDGLFTISATEILDLPVVILEDTETGIITDLKTGSYTFNFSAGQNDQRFIMHFTPLAIPENAENVSSIYSQGKDVYVVVNANTEGSIVIYNVMGQEVTSSAIYGTINKLTLDNSAYYVVKVMSNENVVTEKVFVK